MGNFKVIFVEEDEVEIIHIDDFEVVYAEDIKADNGVNFVEAFADNDAIVNTNDEKNLLLALKMTLKSSTWMISKLSSSLSPRYPFSDTLTRAVLYA